MSTFKLGDKVKNIKNGDVGYIIAVLSVHRGIQYYKVKYNDRENDERSQHLVLDVDLTDVFERLKQNVFGNYTEYLKGNTAFKIKNSNNSTISSLKASKTIFRTYQFKPLLKFLNSDNKRILIADEVGLGKTIEAGHIMLELKARGELRNALVICPKALQEKWTTELNDKFGLEFINIKDKDQLIQELTYHNGYVRAVINYDKIKPSNDILKFIEEREIKFSIIVCDESHRLRNYDTQIHQGVKLLLLQADSAVFMSATPIMIKPDNLFYQLQLLDPNVYDHKEVFRNNLQLNAPFVRALTSLSKGVALKTIKKELESSIVITYNTINDIDTEEEVSIDEYFKEYPIYQQLKKDFLLPDTTALRAKIQYNLAEMSPMSNIFSRTRKKDVTKDDSQTKRNPHTLYIELADKEKGAYDEAIEDYIIEKGGVVYYDEYNRPRSGALGLVTLRRQLASSVWATISSNERLDRGIDDYSDFEDSKFNALLGILDEVFRNGNKKIIIFAIFTKTIKYLNIRLKKAGYTSALIYGSSEINKFEVLNQFQFDDRIQILLSSEVGSEGLDMQFCSCLVNYDLPWNPMVVEQRIGRIDRFGQKSPKVNLYNIVLIDTIVEEIYSRLLDRIGIFRNSIGDLEAILDIEMEQNGKRLTIKDALKKMEQDFYSDKLTKEEAEQQRRDIENAIEYDKIQLKEIEEGLTNSLTNDFYFQNEVNKIYRNNAYVTSNELQKFVVQLMKDYLTTCSLAPSTDNPLLYILKIPKSDSGILRRFLNENEPINPDSRKLFSGYLSNIEDKNELILTFDQEVAFNNKSISYVNIYHPIIQAGIKYYEKIGDKSKKTFFFEIDSSDLESFHKGNYILAIYKISVSRLVFDKQLSTESLYPVLYDIDKGIIIDDHELTESFMGKAQINGKYAPFTDDKKLPSELIDTIRFELKDTIDEYVDNYKKEQEIRIENSNKMRYQQTLQYYDFRISNLEHTIENQETLRQQALIIHDASVLSNAERILPMMRKNLQNLIKSRDDELERINKDVQLKVTEEIKSLNLINVI